MIILFTAHQKVIFVFYIKFTRRCCSTIIFTFWLLEYLSVSILSGSTPSRNCDRRFLEEEPYNEGRVLHPRKSQWNLAPKWATSQQCNTVTMQDSNSTRELITVQISKDRTLPEQRSLWGARSRDGEIIAAWSTDLSSAGWSRCNKTIKLLFPLSTEFLTTQCLSGWFIIFDDWSNHPRGLTFKHLWSFSPFSS